MTPRLFRLWTLLSCLVFASASQARNVFVMPGSSGGPLVNIYSADPLAAAGSFTATASAFRVFSNSTESKFYVVSASTTDSVVIVDATGNVLRRYNFAEPPRAATVTPDGRRLLVAADTLRIIDIITDNQLSFTGDVGTSPIDVEASNDSSRAFVLSAASNRLTAVNLASNSVIGSPITIQGVATGVARAPSDLLYVTAPNRIFEIDGRTMTLRTEIPLNDFPGKMVFTPNGARGISANQNPFTGSLLVVLETATRTVTRYSSGLAPGVTLEKLVPAGNNRVFGLSTGGRSIYEISFSPATVSAASFGGFSNTAGTADLVVSDEQGSSLAPNARFLYAANGTNLYRVDLSSNQVSGQVSLPSTPGALSFTGAASLGPPAAFIAYNQTQNIGTTATALPLVVRVLDSSSRPVNNASVVFTTTSSGLVIQGTNQLANTQGIAQVFVTTPSTPGTYSVTATVAGGAALVANFTLNVATGAAGAAAVLEMVSGNGQIVQQGNTSQEPLKIRVTDTNGLPVSGAPLVWSLSGFGQLLGSAANTDANGEATTLFIGASGLSASTVLQSTISVTSGSLSETFVITTLDGLPIFELLIPSEDAPSLTLGAGETASGAIQVRVTNSSNSILSQVGLRVSFSGDPAVRPSAACVGDGGTALSDGNGIASCDLTLGPRTGSTTLVVNVGGTTFRTIPLTVRAGAPTNIRPTQGNNQRGNPGQSLPLALVAEVTDASGNLIVGAEVQWEVATVGTVTLSNVVSRADLNGRVSALATLGSTPGPVVVRARIGSVVGTFTLEVAAQVSRFSKVSGDLQNAAIGQSFAQPLVVEVIDNSNVPVPNTTVTFQVTSGVATLANPAAVTNAEGRASTAVQAGASAGPIVVVASLGNFSVTFNLSARLPGPAISAASIVNGAGGQPGITPGGVVTIIGGGIAPGIQGSVVANLVTGPLPTTLANVTVTIGSIPAPIYAVSNVNGQESVSVQAPFELVPGTTTVAVQVGTASASVPNVPVLEFQPGIFQTAGPGARLIGVLVKTDGSYVSGANPARAGDVIRMYATGLGQVAPGTGTNRAGIVGQAVAAQVVVGVNDTGVEVLRAEYAPNLIGVYIVDFRIPENTATGAERPLALAIGTPNGLVFGNPSLIPIQ